MPRIPIKPGRGPSRLTKAWLSLIAVGVFLGVSAQHIDKFVKEPEAEQASITLPAAPARFATLDDRNRSSELYDITELIAPGAAGQASSPKQTLPPILDQGIAVTRGIEPAISDDLPSEKLVDRANHPGPKTITVPPLDRSQGASRSAGVTDGAPSGTERNNAEPETADTLIAQLATTKVIKLEALPESNSAVRTQKNNPDITLVFPAAPDASLFRPTLHGPMPQPAADGRRAAQYYARPYRRRTTQLETDSTSIGLIVGGLGLDRDVTQKAIDTLPPNVSLAFAPYARDLTEWAEKARLQGHELLLELPMEHRAQDVAALGSAVLSTKQSWPEKQQRLEWLLTRFAGYFAVTNYLGQKLSSDVESIRPVLNYIDAAGIAYIDDTRIIGKTDISLTSGLGTADVLIPPDTENFATRLTQLESLALQQKRVLGKTYATAENIDMIVSWAQNINPESSIALVPASALIPQRGE